MDHVHPLFEGYALAHSATRFSRLGEPGGFWSTWAGAACGNRAPAQGDAARQLHCCGPQRDHTGTTRERHPGACTARTNRVVRPKRLGSDLLNLFAPKDIWSALEDVASFEHVVGGTVLLVEREGPVRAYLEQQLADDGFEVLAADRSVQALDLAEEVLPDLVLLDAVLPDVSGFELCSRLRDGEPGRRWNRDVPVIMVSSRGDPVDRVRGFARGCDDYIVKPFVYDELVARMRAVLRRSNGPRHPRLTVRDLEIDLASRVVKLAGEPVQLSAKEYELLVALAEDPERVFRKEELLRDVWGFRSLGRTRTLDSHASRLRRKLNNPGENAYVLNVWGVGYRLVAAA
jgi:DNA-binding response OmpR family regulator